MVEAQGALIRKVERYKAKLQQCNATQVEPLQTELHYALTGDYEGVWAMEASVLMQRASATNLNAGAAVAVGGEGWLYLWDIPDPRWQK
jgi:hypothetical protein